VRVYIDTCRSAFIAVLLATLTAIGAFAAESVDDAKALQDVTVEVPELRPRDVGRCCSLCGCPAP